MKLIVDRIEKDTLIVENEVGAFFAVPSALIPGAKEGDVIRITIDNAKTEEQKKHVNALMEELFVD